MYCITSDIRFESRDSTSSILTEVFGGFLKSFRVNAGNVSYVKTRFIYFASFIIPFSLITLHSILYSDLNYWKDFKIQIRIKDSSLF